MEEICQQYRSEEIAQYSNNTWFNTFTSVVSNMLFVPETTEEHNIELPQEIRYYLIFLLLLLITYYPPFLLYKFLSVLLISIYLVKFY